MMNINAELVIPILEILYLLLRRIETDLIFCMALEE